MLGHVADGEALITVNSTVDITLNDTVDTDVHRLFGGSFSHVLHITGDVEKGGGREKEEYGLVCN